MKISILMCGDKRDRTADLLNAIQALSQLSYIPIFSYVTWQFITGNLNRKFIFSIYLTPSKRLPIFRKIIQGTFNSENSLNVQINSFKFRKQWHIINKL